MIPFSEQTAVYNVVAINVHDWVHIPADERFYLLLSHILLLVLRRCNITTKMLITYQIQLYMQLETNRANH